MLLPEIILSLILLKIIHSRLLIIILFEIVLSLILLKTIHHNELNQEIVV